MPAYRLGPATSGPARLRRAAHKSPGAAKLLHSGFALVLHVQRLVAVADVEDMRLRGIGRRRRRGGFRLLGVVLGGHGGRGRETNNGNADDDSFLHVLKLLRKTDTQQRLSVTLDWIIHR